MSEGLPAFVSGFTILRADIERSAFAHRYDVRAGKLDEHPVGLSGGAALAPPDATAPRYLDSSYRLP